MYIKLFSRFSMKTFSRQWYFRVVAANNKIIAVSSEGYSSKTAALDTIHLLKSDLQFCEVITDAR
jgi:uncharacterized protein YegP (UPF0339 family)